MARRLRIAALEPRVLLDGAAIATAVHIGHPAAGDSAPHDLGGTGHAADSHAAGSDLTPPPAPAAPPAVEPPSAVSDGKTLVVVDSRVTDAQTLLDGLAANVDVLRLDAGQSGVAQIAAQLQTGCYSSVDLIAHGSSGSLVLGSDVLTASSVDGALAASLNQWRAGLSDGADVLIWGCDVGSGSGGTALLDALARQTGADIAASTDPTGAAAAGGDWVLEAHTGMIEATAPFQADALSAFDRLLAAPTVSDSMTTTIRATNEDTLLTVTGVTVGDADGGSLTVTLHATDGAGTPTTGTTTGTITLASTANLAVAGNGSGTVSLTGAIADINTALAGMTYMPTTDYNGTARIAVRADDTATITDFNVAVAVISINDAPTLNSTALTVAEGGNASFSAGVVGLADPDIVTGQQTAAQEMVYIATLSSHGTLTFNGSPVAVGTVLSYDQITLLTYTHDGSDVQAGNTDSFNITINDGAIGAANSVPGTLTINLTPVNQAPSVSGSPSVYEGQSDVSMTLTITDQESGHADALANETVTVVSVSLGGEGTLYFDANNNGSFDAGDTTVTAGFTLAGNQTSQLRFSHNGVETNAATPPSFVINVTDNGGGQGPGFELSSGSTTITINIIPVDDNPTLTTNTGFTLPLVAGTNTIYQLTTGNLLVSDVDSPTNQLVYTVVTAPTYGVIQIWVSGSWKTLGVNGRFTQEQIDNGYVRYEEEITMTGGATDSFEVSVRDSAFQAWPISGKAGAIYEADNTTIAIIPVSITLTGDGGTQLGLTPPDVGYGNSGGNNTNSTLPPAPVGGMTNSNIAAGPNTDFEGASGLLTSGMLNYQIADASNTYVVPANETVYTLTAEPTNGVLQVWSGGAWISLAVFGTFTQADIDAGHVQFLHDGGEQFVSSFDYRVSDGGSNALDSTFVLDTTPVNDTPVATGGTIPTVERVVDVFGTVLSEGTVRITTTYMQATDADGAVEPAKRVGEGIVDPLWFEVTSLPVNGILERWDGAAWVAVTTTEWLPTSLLTLSADGGTSGLRYTHGGGDQPSELVDSFDFVVRDDLTTETSATEVRLDGVVGTAASVAAGNLSNTATVDLSVANYNDPPIVRDDPYLDDVTHTTITDFTGAPDTTVNEVLHIATEGSSGTITNLFLNAVDADNTSVQRQYRITTDVANGTVFRNGVALGVGSYFTQADIDAGLITYTHDGSETFTDSFRFIVSDGVFDTQDSIFRIVVDAPANDAPTLAVSSSSVNFATAAAYDFGSIITVADSDLVAVSAGETDFVQVSLTVTQPDTTLYAGATLTLGSTAGITITSGVDGVAGGALVLQGTLADVQAALTHLTLQVATDENRSLTLNITVDDRLRDAGGALTVGANGGPTNQNGTPINFDDNTVTKTITVNASNINDPPVVSNPAAVTVNEDTSLAFTAGNAITVSDPDLFSGSMTVTLGVTHGKLTVGSAGGATVTGSATAAVTLTGTSSQLATALGSLSYQGATDYHGADTLSIDVSDNGNFGAGGAKTTGGSVAITVVPVNDTPTLSAPAATQSLSTGSTVTFSTANGNAIAVADAKDSGTAPFTDNQQMTVTTASGTLVLATTSGLTVTGDGTGTVVLTGSLADINTALDGLVFTAANPNLDGTVVVTATLDDLDNGGTTVGGIGPAQTATANININISGTNDPPVVVAPGTPVTVAEDSSVTLTVAAGTAFSFTDTDDFGAANLSATVTATHGTLTLTGNDGTTVTGSGTAALTLTGTKTQINAALDGLIYTPTGDYWDNANGTATITVTADDHGNTGVGGVTTDSKSITVAITPVNDAPTASGTVSVTATEDVTGSGTVLSTLITATEYSDSTDNQAANGGGLGGNDATALSYVAIVGDSGYVATQGSWQVSDGSGGWITVPDSGLSTTTALVVPADREIRFVPVADFQGTPGSLLVRLADGSDLGITTSANATDLLDLSTNGAIGTTHAWSTGDVTISTVVDPVNDRPTATGAATLATIAEDPVNPPGDTVANLFSGLYGDAADNQTAISGGNNTSTAFGGVAVVGNAATAAEGIWQYDSGSGWVDIASSVSDSTAVLLPTTASLRFVPATNYNGTPGDLTVRLADAAVSVSASSDISGSLTQTDIWSNTTTLSTAVTAVNDGPQVTTAIPDQSNLDSDVVSVDVSTHLVDPEGDAITFSATGLPAGLSIDVNTGVISGTLGHSDSQTGPFAVTVTATNAGGTVSDSFTWAVANPAPLATDNSNAVTVPAPTSAGNMLTNDNGHGVDSDPDGDPVSVTQLASGATSSAVPGAIVGSHGTLTWAADGSYSYTANTSDSAVIALAQGATLTDSFTYTISDGEGGTDTAALVITITGQNEAPTLTSALPDRSNSDSEAISVATAGSFNDVDSGDTGTYTATGLPSGLTINASTGVISGTLGHSDSTSGPYTVTVTRTDGQGASVADSFVWTITNPPPDAIDNSGTVTTAAPTRTGNMVTDNSGKGIDHDPDGDTLTVTRITSSTASSTNGSLAGSYGTLTWTASGGYTYTLDSGNASVASLTKNGTLTETFTYTISDGDGGTDSAALIITITGDNHTPQSIASLPDRHNLDADSVVNITTAEAFTDIDGIDGAAYSATGLPAGLTIDASTGVISGTVASNASVTGSYAVTITRTDSAGASASVGFIWTVDNPPPTALDNGRSVTTTNPTATGNMVGDNDGAGIDSDPDHDTLTVTQMGFGGTVSTNGHVTGAYGSLTWNANGSYSYTLNSGSVPNGAGGGTLTEIFSYTLSDGQGGTSTANLVITITADATAAVSKTLADTNISKQPITLVDQAPGSGAILHQTELSFTQVATDKTLILNSSATVPIVLPVFDKASMALYHEDSSQVHQSFSRILEMSRDTLFSDEINFRHPQLSPLELTVALQDRVLDEGVQTFALPRNAFRHSNPSTLIKVEAKQADGSPLPDYVVFDEHDHTFKVDTDAARAQGVEAIDIKVTGRDAEGNQAGTSFRVTLTEQGGHKGQIHKAPAVPVPDQSTSTDPTDVSEQHTMAVSPDDGGAPVITKPGLAEQLRRIGRNGLSQQRDQLVADAAA